MMINQWEYNVIWFEEDDTIDRVNERLDSWGRDGWELVSVAADPKYNQLTAFFKRPVLPDAILKDLAETLAYDILLAGQPAGKDE